MKKKLIIVAILFVTAMACEKAEDPAAHLGTQLELRIENKEGLDLLNPANEGSNWYHRVPLY